MPKTNDLKDRTYDNSKIYIGMSKTSQADNVAENAQLSDNPFGLASYHSQTSSPASCMTPLSARYCTHILQAPRITRYRPLCQRHIGLQPSQIQKDMIYEGLRFLVQLVTNVSYIAHEEQCDISVQHSEVSFQLNNLVLKY